MTVEQCPTCDGRGLVPPTEEWNAGGPGWAKCPDCDWPQNPERQAQLERIREIQRAAHFGSSQQAASGSS